MLITSPISRLELCSVVNSSCSVNGPLVGFTLSRLVCVMNKKRGCYSLLFVNGQCLMYPGIMTSSKNTPKLPGSYRICNISSKGSPRIKCVTIRTTNSKKKKKNHTFVRFSNWLSSNKKHILFLNPVILMPDTRPATNKSKLIVFQGKTAQVNRYREILKSSP